MLNLENIMVVIGLSFLVLWLLIVVFTLPVVKAVLITGILFIALGLLIEGVPTFHRKP